MKKALLFLTLCLLFLLPPMLFAQTRPVTGVVRDSKDNSPLVDATVSVVGKPVNSKTKTDGTFTINVPSGATQLKISYVGYADQTVDITSDKLTVPMSASSQNLNEVVVIGYGTARKKDLTGAVASIKAKDFNQGTIAAPDQLLQ